MAAPRLHPSSHQAVAEAIRRWIALGTYAPGERLPSERELAEQFAVGRMTVRRAIGELASEGLVTTTRGRAGGTTVQPPTSVLHDVTLEDLLAAVRDSFEFRLAVEPAAAELAAERGGPADGRELEELVARGPQSFGEYRALDSRFHLAVARSSGNPLLFDAVTSSRTHFFGWADVIRRHTSWAELDPAERDFGAHHRAVAEAVAAGRAGDARRLMTEHLLAGEEQYLGLVRAYGSAVAAPPR
jgi:GntR family transcriptional repressor for pyruvate dehydrogenase complex